MSSEDNVSGYFQTSGTPKKSIPMPKEISEEPGKFSNRDKMLEACRGVSNVDEASNTNAEERSVGKHSSTTNAFACAGCQKIFFDKKPLVCDNCQEQFSSVDANPMKFQTNSSENLKCKVCGRKYSTKTALARHLRLHFEKRPFGCDQCGRAFMLKLSLTHHLGTHAVPKPFVCGICRKDFPQKKYLDFHLRRYHPEHASGRSSEKPLKKNGKINKIDESSTSCEQTIDKNDGIDAGGNAQEKYGDEGSTYPEIKQQVGNRIARDQLQTFSSQQIKNTIVYPSEDRLESKTQEEQSEKDKSSLRNSPENIDCNKPPLPQITSVLCNFNLHHYLGGNNEIVNDTLEKHPQIIKNNGQTEEQNGNSEESNPERYQTSSNQKESDMQHQKPFVCPICSKGFPHKKYLDFHLQYYHKGETLISSTKIVAIVDLKKTGEKLYACNICHKSFRQSGTLKKHRRTHDRKQRGILLSSLKVFREKRSVVCQACLEEFPNRKDLHLHETAHHPELLTVCDVCQRVFQNAHCLKEHMLIHTGEKPYSCETCQKRFRQRGTLNTHRLTHEGVKAFPCGQCPRAFYTARALERHRVFCGGNGPYVCEFCEKRFEGKQHLTSHRRTHTGEKPFACEDCGRRFSARDTLKMHRMVHTKERPHKCDICKAGFTKPWNLKVHLRTHRRNKVAAKDSRVEPNSLNVARSGDDSEPSVRHDPADSRGAASPTSFSHDILGLREPSDSASPPRNAEGPTILYLRQPQSDIESN